MKTSNKHTEAFNKQVQENLKVSRPKVSHVEMEAFVDLLSTPLLDKIIGVIAGKSRKAYATNEQIYNHCISHGIKPDLDKYDNIQTEINFKKEPEIIDYKGYKASDDIKINGRVAFVIENNIESKLITVQYGDTDEIEEVTY